MRPVSSAFGFCSPGEGALGGTAEHGAAARVGLTCVLLFSFDVHAPAQVAFRASGVLFCNALIRLPLASMRASMCVSALCLIPQLSAPLISMTSASTVIVNTNNDSNRNNDNDNNNNDNDNNDEARPSRGQYAMVRPCPSFHVTLRCLFYV